MLEIVKILILDDHTDIQMLALNQDCVYEAVLCLFWAAPSTLQRLSELLSAPCFGLSHIIDNEMSWGQAAYEMVSSLGKYHNSQGELSSQLYLVQGLYQECLDLYLVKRTADFITDLVEPFVPCTLQINNLFSPQLRILFSNILSSRFEPQFVVFSNISSAPTSRPGIFQRAINRWKETEITGNWRNQLTDMLSWLDKTYHWRRQMAYRMPEPIVSKRHTCFFSSYLNNSRTLAHFTDLVPGPVHWIYANYSAQQGIPKSRQKDAVALWRFFGARKSNNAEEESSALRYPASINPEDALLKAWLMHSPTWQSWLKIERQLIINLTEAWEAYLDRAQPELIVMANQWSIEGWFMQIAHQRDIPTLQIMHGVLGGYLYTKTPIISDRLTVWGTFWQNLWPESELAKIIIYNANKQQIRVTREVLPHKRITFFSWPLATLNYYNQSELLGGFVSLFAALLKTEACEITIRFHPLENPADFIAQWETLIGKIPSTIHLSKDDALIDILARTDVAIMFRSTVMLDCFANAIPIVMPGWIDFDWNQALHNMPGLYLAKDWDDLEACLHNWLHYPPAILLENYQHFVAPMGDELEFRTLIENLIQSHHKLEAENGK